MKSNFSKFLSKFILSTATFSVFAINSQALSPKNLFGNLKNLKTKARARKTKPSKKNINLSQQNAIKMAKSYLQYSSFSRLGLIRQLEHEKFSTDDATYAVDNCGANWSDQALKMAKSYLEYSAFSAQGLIDQLKHEGFTQEQARYAIEQIGL